MPTICRWKKSERSTRLSMLTRWWEAGQSKLSRIVDWRGLQPGASTLYQSVLNYCLWRGNGYQQGRCCRVNQTLFVTHFDATKGRSNRVLPLENSGVRVKHAESDASTPVRLDVVLRDLVGKALGLLYDLLNWWPSQEARTQRLIFDALGQLLDDPRRLPKDRARLHRIVDCLRHPAQRRQDLPAFARQPQVSGQPCCFAQVVDGLLALSIPRCQHCQRLQVGQAETPVGPQTFPQSLHFCSRLPLIPTTQQGPRFIMKGEIMRDHCHIRAPARGDGLHGIAGGLVPLSGLGRGHPEPRRGGTAK